LEVSQQRGGEDNEGFTCVLKIMEGNAEFMALPEGGGRVRNGETTKESIFALFLHFPTNTVTVTLQMTIHWKGQDRENT